MYAVHDLKAKIFGNYSPFNFSDGCNNKQGNFASSVIHVGKIVIILLEYY